MRHPRFTIPVTLTALVTLALTAPQADGYGQVEDPGSQTGTRPADEDIALAIEKELIREDVISAGPIDVAVWDGVAMLSGTVADLLTWQRAIEVARRTRGVRSIIDRLEVRPKRRSDVEILDDVQTALVMDPATEVLDVTVTVESGTVRLRGVVESWAERRLAEEVAMGVRGVRAIENDIAVDYAQDRPDDEIERDIEARLAGSARVDDGGIRVTVSEGHVGLSGSVGSAAERMAAVSLAYVAGVEDVDYEALEVEPRAREAMRRTGTSAHPDDETIRASVSRALDIDPRVTTTAAVTVEDGVVTLSGVVTDLRARHAAVEDAENTVGVRRVRDLLEVEAEVELPEARLVQLVESALRRDPYLEPHEIRPSAIGGRVFLEGAVDTYYEKSRATTVVSRVSHVTDVVNELTVNTRSIKSDWAIQEDALDQLYWNPWVDAEALDVRVYDGVAVLSGNAESWFEVRQARREVFEAGAREVRVTVSVGGGR